MGLDREALLRAGRGLAHTLADRTAAARAFKAQGGRVVGVMSNNVPVELIHAAGCFPLQLPALPGQATPHADLYMEAAFDPMARSVFERLLQGEFDFLDLIVLPRSVDSFQRFYYYLCELRRQGTEAVPEAWLYDLLQTPWYTSAEYNHARTLELKARLEALVERAVTDDELRNSIAIYNRLRHKLARLSDRRQSVPCGLAGAVALDLFSASQLMLPEHFELELDALLDTTPAAVPGTRVVLIGSAHDEPRLHRVIARAGGQVVGDYHWRGEPLFGPAVDEVQAPIRALSSHYHLHSFGPRRLPVPLEESTEFARAAKAQAAIFYFYAEEEALTWDYPAQRRALDQIGIPSLCLSEQPYPAPDTLEDPVRDFLASVAQRALHARRPQRVKVGAS